MYDFVIDADQNGSRKAVHDLGCRSGAGLLKQFLGQNVQIECRNTFFYRLADLIQHCRDKGTYSPQAFKVFL